MKFLKRFEDGTCQLLWENNAPNNCTSLRPLFLIREKETDEDLLSIVIPATDNARAELASEGVCVTDNMKGYNVKIIIHDSMKDLKLKKKLSGLGGADCILCKTKQADWTTTSKVQEGFYINRSATDNLALYNKLVGENGKIVTASGDFDTRQGLTQKPLTSSDQTSITVTHSYINGVTWFLKVLYRCRADHLHWVEKSGPQGEPIRQAREQVLKAIHEGTGLYLDKVNSTGKGGTSTDENQGRRFFSEEVLECLKGLLDEKHKENVLLLHRQISTILSVVSSSRQVDVTKFKSLCEVTSLHLCNNFPWVLLNHTLHGTMHHSTELISLNDGYGLGSLSEECLESNNKDIRNYLQFLSRKTDPIDQLTDVMARLLERSDPRINTLTASFKPKKYCTECGSSDHTIRSHARLFSSPMKWYNSLAENLFLD